MGIQYVKNTSGPAIGYSTESGAVIIEKDGKFFKNLSKDGVLKPYEDWRLDPKERAKDLASRLSLREIAGLMLYSSHQSIPAFPFGEFGAHYKGKSFEDSHANPWDLTDEQIAFITEDNIRHVLLMIIENPKYAAKWNNLIQELCEKIGYGIPVNISSDPRHGKDFSTEFNMGSKAKERVSVWPESLGLAATFDPEIVRKFGEIASKEYRAMGITTALSPQIDIATDPRWFRFNGTFGEDSNLSTDMAEAYIDGFQTSENGEWGMESVNAMVKHWPGGGSGEGGRDAHFACGKYAVYPKNNANEHMKPFIEGAFKLKGKTKSASAVMPYYTISYNLDENENVGNSYNKHIITDLLRIKCGYDDVICSDWGITDNEASKKDTILGGKCWGVENLSIKERHYKIIEAGVDQFGGNNDIKPVLDAYEIGVKEHGEGYMKMRFEQSAVRLLTNMFRVGIFENPYIDEDECEKIVNNDEYAKEGLCAQVKSIVLLKNKGNVLPIKSRKRVYIPKRYVPGGVSWFGIMQKEEFGYPVDIKEVSKYFDVTDNPDECDFGLVFIQNPNSGLGYNEEDLKSGGNGYVPISLQYRPYTASLAREKSIAGLNRSYKYKTVKTKNECDLDMILEAKSKLKDKPLIVSMLLSNPCVVKEFEDKVDGILVNFGVELKALMKIITGENDPCGLLPMQMPANMETVERQFEDTALDMDCHVDTEGNVYDFGYGLNWSGVIIDERTKKYIDKKVQN